MLIDLGFTLTYIILISILQERRTNISSVDPQGSLLPLVIVRVQVGQCFIVIIDTNVIYCGIYISCELTWAHWFMKIVTYLKYYGKGKCTWCTYSQQNDNCPGRQHYIIRVIWIILIFDRLCISNVICIMQCRHYNGTNVQIYIVFPCDDNLENEFNWSLADVHPVNQVQFRQCIFVRTWVIPLLLVNKWYCPQPYIFSLNLKSWRLKWY